jgi:hypothetical protein
MAFVVTLNQTLTFRKSGEEGRQKCYSLGAAEYFAPALTGSDILKAVNDYFTAEDISWANCGGICSDGAAALTGHKKGFQTEVQQIRPHVNFIRCIIHREALASRDLEHKLKSVLQEAAKVVNFEKLTH